MLCEERFEVGDEFDVLAEAQAAPRSAPRARRVAAHRAEAPPAERERLESEIGERWPRQRARACWSFSARSCVRRGPSVPPRADARSDTGQRAHARRRALPARPACAVSSAPSPCAGPRPCSGESLSRGRRTARPRDPRPVGRRMRTRRAAAARLRAAPGAFAAGSRAGARSLPDLQRARGSGSPSHHRCSSGSELGRKTDGRPSRACWSSG